MLIPEEELRGKTLKPGATISPLRTDMGYVLKSE